MPVNHETAVVIGLAEEVVVGPDVAMDHDITLFALNKAERKIKYIWNLNTKEYMFGVQNVQTCLDSVWLGISMVQTSLLYIWTSVWVLRTPYC